MRPIKPGQLIPTANKVAVAVVGERDVRLIGDFRSVGDEDKEERDRSVDAFFVLLPEALRRRRVGVLVVLALQEHRQDLL